MNNCKYLVIVGILLTTAVISVKSVAAAAPAGQTFYISKTGSDRNSGTSVTSPLRTFVAAAAKMRAGDHCLVMAGVYHQTLQMLHSGLPDKPIVFEPYQKAHVVLDAADPLTHWQPYRGNIDSAPMSWNLGVGMNQVFLDEKMILEARYPEQKTSNPFAPGQARIVVPHNNAKGRAARFSTIHALHSRQFTNKPANYFSGAIFVGQVGTAWSSQSGLVTHSSPQGLLKLNHVTKTWWFAGIGHGYLTGLLQFLKTPDQWEYKAGRLYVDLPAGQTPDSQKIEARRRPWCVDFNSQSWVIVRGFDLLAGSVNMPCNHCVLEDCSGRYMGHFSYIPWGGPNGTGGASIGDCGIVLKGNDNTITHCQLAWSAGSGIVLNGKGNLITRNVISNMDYAGTYATCLDILQGGQNRITFNTIFNAGRDVIQIHKPDADEIEYNNLSHPGLLCEDLGVIYAYGTDGKDTRIAWNWIHDNVARGGNKPGVYLDNGCRNFFVDHNVIWNCGKDAGVRINGPCAGHRIINNTLFNCLRVGARTYISKFVSHKPGWPRGVHYQSINNLELGLHPDRELIDPAHDNFRLKPGAAAIGAGKVVPGITAAVDNKAPDLGAYQTGQPYWIPGVDGHR